MKKCSKCGETKEFGEFPFRKDRGTYRTQCRSCCSILTKEARHRREGIPNKRALNKKVIEIQHLLTDKKCHTCNEWKLIESNFYFSKVTSKWEKSCKACKIEKQVIRIKERKKTDPVFKFNVNIRARIKKYYNKKGFQKSKRTEEILGCDWEMLNTHLRLTFKENYGNELQKEDNVHIDHIIPLSNATTEEELIKLNHYSNLQLLKAEDNIAKSNKLEWTIKENSII